ncbi:unnamed protein product, partial [Rotaria sp. Silwood1]
MSPIENQSTKPIDGICASARWSLSGVTVAGGKGSGSDLDQLYLSDGLFVDANSTVYAVDSGNNRIVKWISGAASGYLVAGGNKDGNSTDQLSYPIDMIIDKNGTMYITDFNNQRVQKWTEGATSGETILGNLNFI